MKTKLITTALGFTLAAMLPLHAAEIPPSITTPDKVETRIGTLEFKDGAPSKDTLDKVYDNLDFTHAFEAFVNTFQGVNAAGDHEGLCRHRGEGQRAPHLLRVDGRQVAVPDGECGHRLFRGLHRPEQRSDGVRDAAQARSAPSTTCGGAGSSTSARPDPIAAKAASISSCRPATTARCPRAASSSPAPGPPAC